MPTNNQLKDSARIQQAQWSWPRNTENASLISKVTGRVAVRVIHTDEELMIARSVGHLFELGPAKTLD